MRLFLMLLSIQVLTAQAMEIAKIQENQEKSLQTAQPFCLDSVSDRLGIHYKYLLHDKWGLIFWAYQGMDQTAQKVLQEIIFCLKLPELLEKDSYEGENLLVDLVSLVRHDRADLSKLLQKSLIKNGREALEKYRSESFKLTYENNHCSIDKEIVAYFPHLRVCKETYNKNEYELKARQNKKSLDASQDNKQSSDVLDDKQPVDALRDYDLQILIAFKKLLYLFYGICKTIPFHKCNQLMVHHGTLGEHKRPLRIAIENNMFVNEHHSELLELALHFDILPLVKILLTSLKNEDAPTIEEYTKNIDLKYFPTIAEIMGHSKFIASLIVSKLNRATSKLIGEKCVDPKTSQLVSECLDMLAKSIEWLQPFKPKTGERDYKKIPFYEQLDSNLQEAFKLLIMDKYAIPSYNAKEIRGSGLRAGHIDDNSIWYSNEQCICLELDLGKTPLYLATLSCTFSSVINCPYPQREKLWLISGNKEGIVTLYLALFRENKYVGFAKQVIINPLPGSGKVTKIIQQGPFIIVAYHCGAIGRFDMSKHFAQLSNTPTNEPIVIASMKEMYLNPEQETLQPENKPAISDSAASERYLIAAFNQYQQNTISTIIKIWEGDDRKSIAVSHHVVTIAFLNNNNQVALGCEDGTVLILDLKETKIVQEICLSKKAICALAILGQKENYLAIAYLSGRVHIWDLRRNILVTEIRGDDKDHTSISLYVLKKNKAILEVIYDNSHLTRSFIRECGRVSDVIDVLHHKLYLS